MCLVRDQSTATLNVIHRGLGTPLQKMQKRSSLFSCTYIAELVYKAELQIQRVRWTRYSVYTLSPLLAFNQSLHATFANYLHILL